MLNVPAISPLRRLLSYIRKWADRVGLRSVPVTRTDDRGDKKERPIVSVVMGSYNRFRLLQRAIESVRSYEIGVPYEIIVIDGGSTDGALEWLINQKDIITIVQHNRGEFRGRTLPRRSWGYFMNLGFKVAQGKYILMMSDDCLLHPQAVNNGMALYESLERQLERQDRKIGGVAFYFRNWPGEDRYYVQNTLGGKLMVNHGLFLREAVAKVGWADEERYAFYKADGDLCLKLWEAGYEIVNCPGSIVEHYFDPGEAVRLENNSDLENDRAAYAQRWKHLLQRSGPNKLGISRIYIDYVDPERTAETMFQGQSHVDRQPDKALTCEQK